MLPFIDSCHCKFHLYTSLKVKSLFHTYLDIPRDFPADNGVPKVSFVTSASENFLEAGQAKVPGGYNEYVWSLPRWHWIDLQRVLLIKGMVPVFG
jgi:hypothetical protein